MPSVSRLRSKLSAFTSFTQELARLSTCARLKVGCVIVPTDLSTVQSIGYNGPPSGEPNDGCRASEGACGCCHAEANALVKPRPDRSDLVLITSRSPCEHCAGLILNSRSIVAVLYEESYRITLGVDLLSRRGVVVRSWGEVLGVNEEPTEEGPGG